MKKVPSRSCSKRASSSSIGRSTPSSAPPRSNATSRERSICVNEAHKNKYPIVLTGPPLAPSKQISFLDSDASIIYFLIITMLISNCRVSKILVDGGSSINILYGGTLNRMEDTPKTARAVISPQPNLTCMGLTGMRHTPWTQFRSQFVWTVQCHHGVLYGGHGVPLQRNTREILAPHDKGRIVHLSPTGVVPYYDGDG